METSYIVADHNEKLILNEGTIILALVTKNGLRPIELTKSQGQVLSNLLSIMSEDSPLLAIDTDIEVKKIQ